MSIATIEPAPSARPTLRATVDLPDPEPPPRLRIIGPNVFHGAPEPRPDANGALRGGAAYVAAAIRSAESECRLPSCLSILLDGGDGLQGTPASNLPRAMPVV